MTDLIIVTHNSEGDLRELPSVTLEAFARVIVVDSGSTDASREVARGLGAEVIARPNDGFGVAANAGAQLAQGEIFALMNPDIRFRSLSVEASMAQLFASEPDIGLAAPALELPDGHIQDSARTVPTPVNVFRRRWSDRRSGALSPRERADVPWVVGACVFIRRRAFTEVDGFDPAFFLYFEDVDLCVRLRRAGWRVVLDPANVALHEHRGESRRSLTGWATRRHIESSLRFWRKHPACAAGLDARVNRAKRRP